MPTIFPSREFSSLSHCILQRIEPSQPVRRTSRIKSCFPQSEFYRRGEKFIFGRIFIGAIRSNKLEVFKFAFRFGKENRSKSLNLIKSKKSFSPFAATAKESRRNDSLSCLTGVVSLLFKNRLNSQTHKKFSPFFLCRAKKVFVFHQEEARGESHCYIFKRGSKNNSHEYYCHVLLCS